MIELYDLNVLKAQYPDIPAEIWYMLDNVDTFTYNHSIRVCGMCQIVEKELNYSDKTLSEAGLLHDIGKYYISQKILEKRGPLTASERKIIDTHAFLSYDILKQFHIPKEICEIALYHHTTTPNIFGRKLKACTDERMKELAFVMKTIDIFEAITSDRPYHRGISVNSAKIFFEDIEHNKTVLDILVNTNDLQRN